MSYRSLKRLFGETSLERKFRFLLGSSLMILISGSFYWYAQRSQKVIELQYRQRAQLLIAQNLQQVHWQHSDAESIKNRDLIQALSKALKPEDVRELSWKFIDTTPQDARPISAPAKSRRTKPCVC